MRAPFCVVITIFQSLSLVQLTLSASFQVLKVKDDFFQPLRVLQNLDVKEKDKDENIFIKLSRDWARKRFGRTKAQSPVRKRKIQKERLTAVHCLTVQSVLVCVLVTWLVLEGRVAFQLFGWASMSGSWIRKKNPSLWACVSLVFLIAVSRSCNPRRYSR